MAFAWIMDIVVINGFIYLLGSLTPCSQQTLGRIWGISTTREVKLLPDHQLIDQSLYTLVRHPMYLGWWMAMLDMILIFWTWIVLIIFVLSMVVFYKRVRQEKVALAERFGDQWQVYLQQSKFLIPRIF